MMNSDIVILGAGMAGLATALYLHEKCPQKKVLILDKKDGLSSNTNFAQGGMAAVFDLAVDSFDAHIKDTMAAGRNLNDLETVKRVISRAPEVILDLVSWGADFDKDSLHSFQLGLEGGHAFPRIVHHKDKTGAEIHRILRGKVKSISQIQFFSDCMAVDLIVQGGVCDGVLVFQPKTGKVIPVSSNLVILATGGVGQLFQNTSNPVSATGDGLAMAVRAGAAVADLEYYQFHPTALYESGAERNFLITEAIRGAGAYIINGQGDRFLLSKEERGELATRDKVTSWILDEMRQSESDHVFLDARHIGRGKLMRDFPQVYEYCIKAGFDLAEVPIPVLPAAHYQCGGIKVNPEGMTNIRRLFAVGECSRTGLHGANRLASNSLPEAMVFSKEIARYIAEESWDTFDLEFEPDLSIPFDASIPFDFKKVKPGIFQLKKWMTEMFLKQLSSEQVEDLRQFLACELDWVEQFWHFGYLNESLLTYRNLLTVAQAMMDAKYPGNNYVKYH